LPEKPDEGALLARIGNKAVMEKIEAVPEIDWLAHSYRQFPPFAVGSFFIYGSHYDGAVPEDLTGLQIDAATAFGSGEHGTTSGCILALLDLNEQGVCPWNVLDMGTGSGILALAAYKIWKTPVLGVDNDEECVRVSIRHRDVNNIPSGATGVDFEAGDGFRANSAQTKKPFDLVIANILAGPLKDMAADLKAVCDDNAFVILSGILNTQADDVAGVYAKLGLMERARAARGDWSTLVLQNVV
jgi:ribosomal protein L11 methyltransferase